MTNDTNSVIQQVILNAGPENSLADRRSRALFRKWVVNNNRSRDNCKLVNLELSDNNPFPGNIDFSTFDSNQRTRVYLVFDYDIYTRELCSEQGHYLRLQDLANWLEQNFSVYQSLEINILADNCLNRDNTNISYAHRLLRALVERRMSPKIVVRSHQVNIDENGRKGTLMDSRQQHVDKHLRAAVNTQSKLIRCYHQYIAKWQTSFTEARHHQEGTKHIVSNDQAHADEGQQFNPSIQTVRYR